MYREFGTNMKKNSINEGVKVGIPKSKMRESKSDFSENNGGTTHSNEMPCNGHPKMRFQ